MNLEHQSFPYLPSTPDPLLLRPLHFHLSYLLHFPSNNEASSSYHRSAISHQSCVSTSFKPSSRSSSSSFSHHFPKSARPCSISQNHKTTLVSSLSPSSRRPSTRFSSSTSFLSSRPSSSSSSFLSSISSSCSSSPDRSASSSSSPPFGFGFVASALLPLHIAVDLNLLRCLHPLLPLTTAPHPHPFLKLLLLLHSLKSTRLSSSSLLLFVLGIRASRRRSDTTYCVAAGYQRANPALDSLAVWHPMGADDGRLAAQRN